MRLIAFLAALVALVFAAEAPAAIEIARDDAGRAIRFDVRAPGVDVEWFAAHLRAAAHEDEISRVTIRVVRDRDVARTCGALHAGGCYSRVRALIVVPSSRSSTTAHALLHEYAHHLDRWRGVRDVPEPNGTAHWWEARGMSRRVAAGDVAHDYSLGWHRSVAEVFAEDYARLHLELPYKIEWLARPDETIRSALRLDVSGVPDEAGIPPPLVIVRSGRLAPRAENVVRFTLIGPDRRVTAAASVAGAARPGTRARLVLQCAGRTVVRRLARGRASLALDEPGLGPATSCFVALRSAAVVTNRFTLRVRLAIERT